jgi:hypothetical protein
MEIIVIQPEHEVYGTLLTRTMMNLSPDIVLVCPEEAEMELVEKKQPPPIQVMELKSLGPFLSGRDKRRDRRKHLKK